MNIFIYVLKDPNNNEIRYVGKTKNTLNKRLYEHCTIRNLKPKTHKNFWIKLLLSNNRRPIIELLEICNENNWKKREIFWINQFTNLTNTTLGGEGALGFSHKPETIKRIIETKKKNGTLSRSKECRERISESHKGKKMSDTTKLILLESTRKPISQFDLDNNFVRDWNGVRDCASKLNIDHCGITRCLKAHQKQYNGFIWKYK